MSVPPFETTVTDHGPTVMRVCCALLRPADAEDAWAETFLAALRAYPTLRPDSNIRGWLVTIAHRKALDQLRASGRRAVPSGEIEIMVDATSARAADAGTPADRVHDTIDASDGLWAAVQALTPNQRTAVIYHHIAGMPFAEIGELLGISAAAARRSSADAIAHLRRRHAADDLQEVSR